MASDGATLHPLGGDMHFNSLGTPQILLGTGCVMQEFLSHYARASAAQDSAVFAKSGCPQMSWFYMHIRCNGELIEDDEGAKFADVGAARTEAVRSIRSLVCGDVTAGFLHLDLSIEIRDDQNRRLQEVAFEDAVSIRGDRSTPD